MNLIEAVGASVFQGWIRIEELNRRRPTVEASHPDYAVLYTDLMSYQMTGRRAKGDVLM